MGYYSHFSLKASKTAIAEFRKFSEGAKYALNPDGSTYDTTKWYDHEADLVAFSSTKPLTLLELTAVGEDGNSWRIYARGGKSYTVEAGFPPFDPAKLE